MCLCELRLALVAEKSRWRCCPVEGPRSTSRPGFSAEEAGPVLASAEARGCCCSSSPSTGWPPSLP